MRSMSGRRGSCRPAEPVPIEPTDEVKARSCGKEKLAQGAAGKARLAKAATA